MSYINKRTVCKKEQNHLVISVDGPRLDSFLFVQDLTLLDYQTSQLLWQSERQKDCNTDKETLQQNEAGVLLRWFQANITKTTWSLQYEWSPCQAILENFSLYVQGMHYSYYFKSYVCIEHITCKCSFVFLINTKLREVKVKMKSIMNVVEISSEVDKQRKHNISNELPIWRTVKINR